MIRRLLAVLVFAPATTLAQAPHLAAASTFTSGSGADCQQAIAPALHMGARGVEVSVLPAPISTASNAAAGVVRAAFARELGTSWQVRASGVVGSMPKECAIVSNVSRGFVELARTTQNGGVALSYGYRSLSALDPSHDSEGWTASIWRDARGARFALALRSHRLRGVSQSSTRQVETLIPDSTFNDTTGGYNHYNRQAYTTDTTVQWSDARALDLRASVAWNIGRLAVDVTAGGTGGVTNRSNSRGTDTLQTQLRPSALQRTVVQLWARSDFTFAATPYLDLHAGLAAVPALPGLTSSLRGVALLGVTVRGLGGARPPASAVDAPNNVAEVVRQDSLRVTVRFRVPGATHVELSGEPTEWTPVAMQPARNGWWESTLEVPAGSYRMSIRVNGEGWRAPPGTVAVRDEFGSESGLVLVR